MAETRICAIEGCGKPQRARNLCMPHYQKAARKPGFVTPRRGMKRADWIRTVAMKYQGDDCLKWPGPINRYYRPMLFWDGRLRKAMQLICELTHGPRPSADHDAAHSCGKGHEGCVNPRHIRWLTHLENMREIRIHQAGRRRKRKVLSANLVGEIRGSSETAAQVADRLGMSAVAISRIRLRKTWAHLP